MKTELLLLLDFVFWKAICWVLEQLIFSENFYWNITYIQRSAGILSVQLQTFSLNDHSHVTSILVKKQKITSLRGTSGCFWFPPLPTWLTTFLISDSKDYSFCLFFNPTWVSSFIIHCVWLGEIHSCCMWGQFVPFHRLVSRCLCISSSILLSLGYCLFPAWGSKAYTQERSSRAIGSVYV